MENLFTNYKDQMLEIVQHVYRKLKSYIYYSNNILYAKKMIAEFEYSDKKMDEIFSEIVFYLCSDEDNSEYIESLVKRVKYKVLPKVSIASKVENQQVISNLDESEIQISDVNFFFDAPIEIWIFDMLWSLIIGYLMKINKLIPKQVKANIFDGNLFSFGTEDVFKNINFKSLSTFVPYFQQYKKWKNGAVFTMNSMYDKKEDSILFSLDISGYFYSVDFKFDELYKDIDNKDDILGGISRLSKIIESVYAKYTSLISKNRTNIERNSLILPIGLVSAAVLGNYCLLKFDKKILNEIKPVYYARYVDDILIIFKNNGQTKGNEVFDFVNRFMPNLFRKEGDRIYITEYKNMYIQDKKIKIIKMNSSGSKAELKLLLEQISNTSEVNLLPNKNLSLDHFHEYIYEQKNEYMKIRDLNNTSIDKYRLMNFISSFLLLKRNTEGVGDYFYDLNESNVKKKISSQFEQIDYETKQQFRFLFKSNAIFELYNRWDRIFLFLLLTNQSKTEARGVYKNLHDQISSLHLLPSSKIISSKRNYIERRLGKDLKENLKIALCLAIAVRNINVKKFEKQLSEKIRKSNIFDHSMVSCPLVNYIKDVNQQSFHYASYNKYFSELESYQLDERKIKYTPRFIHMREYYIYKSVFYVESINEGGFLENIKDEYTKIREIIGAGFYKEPVISEASKTSKLNYIINAYSINSKPNQKDDDAKFNIGLANINIENTQILKNKKIYFGPQSSNYKYKIYQLLEEVIKFNKDKCNKNIRFLVFPELAIPMEWLNDLARYVQTTGIVIICGVKYMRIKNRVYNLVAVILPIISPEGYHNALVVLREKNDYAPLEKKIMENQNLAFNQSDVSRYDLINFNGIKFSVFSCYELTDIYARANLRDRIDMLFAIEYNEDISYFSNIVESSCRDMYSFVVQVNSSNFGYTRIIAPFNDKKKDIAHIKGGELDLVHVGQINLKEFWQYLAYTKTPEYQNSLDQQLSYKAKSNTNKFRKYKKMSARTKK